MPAAGVYGDVLSMQGSVAAPAGTEVTLFSDGRPLAGVVTGADGRFAFPYRLERVDAGRHAAYASAGAAISDERNFTVEERNTTVDLAVAMVSENGTWTALCTGVLATEDGVPVRDALVEVYFDDWSWADGYTAENGSYAINATYLEPGRHNLTARYYPDDLPLNWSESAPVEVAVPTLIDSLAPLLYLVGLGVAAVGAVLYLRRRQALPSLPAAARRPGRRPSPWSCSRPRRPSRRPPGPRPSSRPGSTGARPSRGSTGGSCASSTSATRASSCSRSRRASSRPGSPRAPAGEALGRLVRVHERVRYAGLEPTEEDIRLVREAFIHVISESGSH